MIHSTVVTIVFSISVGTRLTSIARLGLSIEPMYARFVRLNSLIHRPKGQIYRDRNSRN